MTVYVIQNQRQLDEQSGEYVDKFDLSPAKKFGEIQCILSPTAKPFINPTIIREIHDKLSSFRDDDYLILIGNPALIGMATAIAAWYNSGNVKLLQWNKPQKGYIPIIVENLFSEDLDNFPENA